MEQFYSFIWSWLLHLLRWFQEVTWLNTDLCVLYESGLRGQGFNYYLTIIRRTPMIEQSSTWQWNEGKKLFLTGREVQAQGGAVICFDCQGDERKTREKWSMERPWTTNWTKQTPTERRQKLKTGSEDGLSHSSLNQSSITRSGSPDPALKISFNQYWMF